MLPSKQYVDFENLVVEQIRLLFGNTQPIDFPINLQAVFYREKAYKSDLVNYMQALCDALVKAEFIKDDNVNIVQSIDGSRVYTDKENPRIEVTVTKVEEDGSNRQGTGNNRRNIIQMDFDDGDMELKPAS